MSSKIEVIKQTFLAGESMNVDNFVKFFTDDCRYKFGNFPEAHGPQGIVNTSGEFLKRVKAVKHNILDYCETEENVFVEMTVDYTMMDGTIHSLPVCDSIVIENDKVKEMKIFMDLFSDFTFLKGIKYDNDYNIKGFKKLMYHYCILSDKIVNYK